jgi:Asp-tRNA(Asn)/Glu-tRNA(Gln) amidotransferase A subunit family amidase
MSAAGSPLPDLVADPLVLGVVHGDRAAWFELTLHIEQWVEAHVPHHWRMRKARLARSHDDVRDVLLATLERVDRDDFRVLREYLERKQRQVPDVRSATHDGLAELSFASWLAGLVDFAIRDHVRKRYGRAPSAVRQAGQDDEPAALPVLTKRSLHSWAVHPTETQSGQYGSAAPGLSRLLTARSILRYAGEVFDARELRFFERYLEHGTFDELAQEFALPGPELARAEVRRLKERLRARFREVH